MANFLRVSIGGGMPGGEVWSVNPCFGYEAPGHSFSEEELNDIAVAVAAVDIGGLQATMSGFTNVRDVRVEARTWAGALEGVAEATRSSPINGSGSSRHPYQTSVVFSLRTLSTSARGKGRLYWPATGVAIDTDSLRMSSTTRDAIAEAAVDWLGAVETAIHGVVAGAQLIVWSRTDEAGRYVNRVLVGDVLDTQRRRRDTLVESTVTVPYGL